MKNLVPQSLNEAMATSKKLNRKLKKEGGDVVKTDKAAEAIAALKKQIADVKKPGGAKTTIEKRAKVAELEAKIKAWQSKKKVNESEVADDDKYEAGFEGIYKAIDDGNICYDAYDLERKDNYLSFWTDPTYNDDDADHFEWELGTDGNLSVTAMGRGRNGRVITGWNYEKDVLDTDTMEEAYDEFQNGGSMPNWI